MAQRKNVEYDETNTESRTYYDRSIQELNDSRNSVSVDDDISTLSMSVLSPTSYDNMATVYDIYKALLPTIKSKLTKTRGLAFMVITLAVVTSPLRWSILLGVLLVLCGFVGAIFYFDQVLDTSESRAFISKNRTRLNETPLAGNAASTETESKQEISKPASRLLSEKVLASLKEILNLFIRDFILTWLTPLTAKNCQNSPLDQEAVDAVRSTLNASLDRLVDIMFNRKQNATSLLIYGYINALLVHLSDFRRYEASRMSFDEFWREYEYTSHCFDKEAELDHLRQLSDLLITRLLPPTESNSLCLRSILRELLAANTLYPMMNRLSEPDYINIRVVQSLRWYARQSQKDSVSRNLIPINFILKLTQLNNIPSLPSSELFLQFEIEGRKKKSARFSLHESTNLSQKLTFTLLHQRGLTFFLSVSLYTSSRLTRDECVANARNVKIVCSDYDFLDSQFIALENEFSETPVLLTLETLVEKRGSKDLFSYDETTGWNVLYPEEEESDLNLAVPNNSIDEEETYSFPGDFDNTSLGTEPMATKATPGYNITEDLILDEVLQSNELFADFYDYMNKISAPPFLAFWMNADSFRRFALMELEMQDPLLSEYDEESYQEQGDDFWKKIRLSQQQMLSIRRDALDVYVSHFGLDPKLPIPMEFNILADLESHLQVVSSKNSSPSSSPKRRSDANLFLSSGPKPERDYYPPYYDESESDEDYEAEEEPRNHVHSHTMKNYPNLKETPTNSSLNVTPDIFRKAQQYVYRVLHEQYFPKFKEAYMKNQALKRKMSTILPKSIIKSESRRISKFTADSSGHPRPYISEIDINDARRRTLSLDSFFNSSTSFHSENVSVDIEKGKKNSISSSSSRMDSGDIAGLRGSLPLPTIATVESDIQKLANWISVLREQSFILDESIERAARDEVPLNVENLSKKKVGIERQLNIVVRMLDSKERQLNELRDASGHLASITEGTKQNSDSDNGNSPLTRQPQDKFVAGPIDVSTLYLSPTKFPELVLSVSPLEAEEVASLLNIPIRKLQAMKTPLFVSISFHLPFPDSDIVSPLSSAIAEKELFSSFLPSVVRTFEEFKFLHDQLSILFPKISRLTFPERPHLPRVPSSSSSSTSGSNFPFLTKSTRQTAVLLKKRAEALNTIARKLQSYLSMILSDEIVKQSELIVYFLDPTIPLHRFKDYVLKGVVELDDIMEPEDIGSKVMGAFSKVPHLLKNISVKNPFSVPSSSFQNRSQKGGINIPNAPQSISRKRVRTLSDFFPLSVSQSSSGVYDIKSKTRSSSKLSTISSSSLEDNDYLDEPTSPSPGPFSSASPLLLSDPSPPLTEAEMSMLMETFFALIEELFDLQGKNRWLRRKIFVLFKQLIKQAYGDSIGRSVSNKLRDIASEKQQLELLRLLKDSFWPYQEQEIETDHAEEEGKWVDGGSSPSVPRASSRCKRLWNTSDPFFERTHAERHQTAKDARTLLLAQTPESLNHLVGRLHAVQGMTRLYAMLQNKQLNKHLLYVWLDITVKIFFGDPSSSNKALEISKESLLERSSLLFA